MIKVFIKAGVVGGFMVATWNFFSFFKWYSDGTARHVAQPYFVYSH